MSDGLVILGGFVFLDHEIPDKIPFGGKQAHKIHEMVGDQRVVDAMGPSPDNISWSGRFRGAEAIARAQTLDAMRIAGAAVQLSWLGLFYTVLIVDFRGETEKFYEVPYTITCVVVDDPSADDGGVVASLDSLVGGDLSTAAGILAAGTPDVASALSGLSAAVSAIPQLQGASAATLARVLLAAQSAENAISADMTANDPALNAASPDGADPSVLASWLTNTGQAMVAQSGLADGLGYVSRIATNVTLGAN
ncbi:MAG TPA: hypothetical protein VEF90_16465 [Xanthobacteraceae bacterium]|nr:hypothetical protein [Xanthobacteraceae bacterium]